MSQFIPQEHQASSSHPGIGTPAEPTPTPSVSSQHSLPRIPGSGRQQAEPREGRACALASNSCRAQGGEVSESGSPGGGGRGAVGCPGEKEKRQNRGSLHFGHWLQSGPAASCRSS